MDILKCQCCGGRINLSTYRCEYCGTQYKRDDSNYIHVVTHNASCHVLKSKMMLDREVITSIGENNTAKMATEQLARNLADSLAQFMRIETEYDPCTMRQIVTATVRVIEPDYRF